MTMSLSPLDTGAVDLLDDYEPWTDEEIKAAWAAAFDDDDPDWSRTTPNCEHHDANN